MTDVNDMDLVREYTARNSEAAFAELVQRHINLVYSVAFRYVGNSQDAQDVAQAVFITFAKKAGALRDKTIVGGWLYETTRLTAMQFLRSKIRRQSREQEAHMQSASTDSATDTESNWQQIAPLLEDAMTRLSEQDRTLLALRFFENKSGAETASALGIEEWAARKRVARALEKLRKCFSQRGINISLSVLIGVMTTSSAQAAPAALATSITAVAISKGAAASVSTLTLVKGTIKIMAWTKIKTALVVGVAVTLTAGTATTLAVKHYLSPRTLKIRAFIDGTDIIKIQGKKLWYEHESYNFPGDPKSRKAPTTVNGFAWQPKWNEQTSVALENLAPAFKPGSVPEIKLTKLMGRGDATILELPTPENNRTLSIYLNDDEPGADWYEVIVEWKP